MSAPRLLQGIFEFEGQGLDKPSALEPLLTYTVPVGNEAQFVYFRGGNTSAELVCAIVVRDGEPMRYFPIGARGGHAPRIGRPGAKPLLTSTYVPASARKVRVSSSSTPFSRGLLVRPHA